MDRDVAKAEEYTSLMLSTFDNIIDAIHTKRASVTILEHYKHFIIDYKNKGYIDDADYLQLRKDIDRKMIMLENYVFQWSMKKDINYFTMEYPIFQELTSKQQDTIRTKATQKKFQKGQFLFKKNQRKPIFFFPIALEASKEVHFFGERLEIFSRSPFDLKLIEMILYLGQGR